VEDQKPTACPVSDLAAEFRSEFDMFDAEYNANPGPVWKEMRETCPFSRSEERGGFWVSTTYADAQALVRKVPELSNRQVSVVELPEGKDLMAHYNTQAFPPITMDPPDNIPLRRLMLPFFTPKATAVHRAYTEELCNELIDGFIDKGECDAAVDYAQQITPRVISHILGIDPNKSEEFTGWVRGMIELGFEDIELRAESHGKIVVFFTEQLALRRENPGDDFISLLARETVDGEPLADKTIIKMCVLTLIAGIDTTWSSIGSSMWHFASHPEDRRRLAAEPELFSTAIEEMLRLHAPVSVGRIAMEDVEHGETTMKRGERLVINFPAANRDPEVFENPDEAVLDRQKNRHIAFGIGIHRCAGSNLARMEMEVALKTWFARIPEFELTDPDAVVWAPGQVRGARKVPVRF
jgi:cytochrome P450